MCGEPEGYEAYCDMSTNSGGWTLVLTTSDNSGFVYGDTVWTDASAAGGGSLLNPQSDTDGVSRAFYELVASETRLCLERYDDSVITCVVHLHPSPATARDLANQPVLSSSFSTTNLLPSALQSASASGVWNAPNWHRYGWNHGIGGCGALRLGFTGDRDGSDSRDCGIGLGLGSVSCGATDPGGSGYYHYPPSGGPSPLSAGLSGQIWMR